ncbi:secretin N-terminal domain-containing protein [Caldimonas tepidiphila]|uniref:secretin N-terminal domain-containing protein n=1 Tax=Caldimonas tepidiphila TaxID=2315841 RepID=UPI000E5BDB05|nr:secretin N-terminal domain-containing protein [Caldimonas tepidiphila]
MNTASKRARLAPALCVSLLLLTGCAAQRLQREGAWLLEQGRYEEGLERLQQASRRGPDSGRLRAELRNRQEQVVQRLLQAADAELAAGRLDAAEAAYRRVLRLQAGTPRAEQGIEAVARERRHAELLRQAEALQKKGEVQRAEAPLRAVLAENPRHPAARALLRQLESARLKEALNTPPLRPRLTKPVDVEFRDASVKMVFEGLSRLSDINFVFDREVRADAKTTIYARQVSVEDAVDLILLTNQLEKKVLSENMLLIYPGTPQKLREYQDLVIKSFYLENADPKHALNTIKTMLKTRDVVIDEKLNLLVMRDTPEAVRLAEKLIAAQDLAEPEVMLEVEVVEISHARLTELGVKWPDQLTLGLTDPTGGSLLVSDLQGINSGRITINNLGATVNARKLAGDSNILASPRIRVRNREKARILIGDRVPVISSQVTPSTGTPVVTENVQYLDVGLKLEVEPNVHLDEDVAIKVNLEVSTLGEQVRTGTGTVAYRVGTRNAGTVLRLRDGETQVLVGLIRNDERKAANKVPGLGELPVLGRLFGTHQNENQKTEIVLSITPRVVRNLRRVDVETAEFWSGSEATLRTQPVYARAITGPAAPAAPAAPAVAGAASAAGPGAAAAAKAAPEGAAPTAAVPKLPAGTAAAARGLSWQAPAKAKVGELFTLALRASTDEPISSAALQLGFDPAAFELVEVKEGALLKQDDVPTSFSQQADAQAGRLTVRLARPGSGGGAVGEGEVLGLTFRARSPASQARFELLELSSAGPGNRAVALPLPAPLGVDVLP